MEGGMREMHGRLSGKTMLIIGGARGIGRGITEGCAAEGANLVIADISAERDSLAARLTQEGAETLASALDVRIAADHERVVAEAIERFGRIDGMIYCAGIFPRATLAETDELLWHRVLDTNLTGAFLACRVVMPHMIARGGGSIVTIGSLHARCGARGLLAYSVSKGGLVTLTRNLAASYASDRIRVNCVHPGWVLSEGEVAVRQIEAGRVEQFAEQMGVDIPLGRMQTPEDIARMVTLLLSDHSSQITGQVIAVDGGLGGRTLA
jgi:NAD(P)-dependent dehydrogenase (short-subunit alcohol dehydrogenase family)